MKMDRNLVLGGLGKYTLINLRKLSKTPSDELLNALEVLRKNGIIELGQPNEADEFFVIKLRDINAHAALTGYAVEADKTDPEWANEVREMLPRSGENSFYCKQPD